MDSDLWTRIMEPAAGHSSSPPAPIATYSDDDLQAVTRVVAASKIRFASPTDKSEQMRLHCKLHSWSSSSIDAMLIVAICDDGRWCITSHEASAHIVGNRNHIDNILRSHVSGACLGNSEMTDRLVESLREDSASHVASGQRYEANGTFVEVGRGEGDSGFLVFANCEYKMELVEPLKGALFPFTRTA